MTLKQRKKLQRYAEDVAGYEPTPLNTDARKLAQAVLDLIEELEGLLQPFME